MNRKEQAALYASLAKFTRKRGGTAALLESLQDGCATVADFLSDPELKRKEKTGSAAEAFHRAAVLLGQAHAEIKRGEASGYKLADGLDVIADGMS